MPLQLELNRLTDSKIGGERNLGRDGGAFWAALVPVAFFLFHCTHRVGSPVRDLRVCLWA